ncbi:thiol peroxidase [Vibrio sp. T20]|uniref:thiol peroxidase n=1 Tax=Vibrio sp. T20 TaxID=2588450 RepID=UPI0011B40F2C|nr:thiol peroxidase [Vibrio sp. T20]
MLVTFLGNPVELVGNFPKHGHSAPDFTLCDKNLNDINLSSFYGKKVVLNIFPSIDTPVCANSVKTFNNLAREMPNTVVLCVSADLPFAQARFIEAERLENVSIASCFRSPTFSTSYGVNINEGALKGLTSRAVIVFDESCSVIHSELVDEITEEPNYENVTAAVKGA